MQKKPLIGFSILAVVLLILGSLGNVVGYQTVKTSQHTIIKEGNNQKELLFQTILDLANNKEIQQIIQKSPRMNEQSLYTDAKLPKTITKQQLRRMYVIGQILSKRISKERIQSMIQTQQLITPNMQQKIDAVIANDAILNEEITQLLNSDCDFIENTGFGIKCLSTYIYHVMVGCNFINNNYAIGFSSFVIGWVFNGNNFINNSYNFFIKESWLRIILNKYNANYYDDWDGTGRYHIYGFLNWDRNPASEPYDI